MPVFALAPAAATAFWGATAAGTSAAASLYGARKQSQAAERAARTQSDAATRAAELEAQSQADALAYQKQQDQLERESADKAARLTYQQWADRERLIGSTLGGYLGLPGRNPSPYDSAITPGGGGATGSATGPAGPGSVAGVSGSTRDTTGGGGDGSMPALPADLQTAVAQANQIAYGGRNKHNDPNYWAAMWAKDPGYTWRRLLGEGAGAGDAPVSGPYAGQRAAAKAPMTSPNLTSYIFRPSTRSTYVQTPALTVH